MSGRCPLCDTRFWIHEEVFEVSDKCDCYVHSCDKCGNILCSFSIGVFVRDVEHAIIGLSYLPNCFGKL